MENYTLEEDRRHEAEARIYEAVTELIVRTAERISPADEAPETVASVFACPCCGERRVDRLYWNKAGTVVTCSTCSADYDPNEA